MSSSRGGGFQQSSSSSTTRAILPPSSLALLLRLFFLVPFPLSVLELFEGRLFNFQGAEIDFEREEGGAGVVRCLNIFPTSGKSSELSEFAATSPASDRISATAASHLCFVALWSRFCLFRGVARTSSNSEGEFGKTKVRVWNRSRKLRSYLERMFPEHGFWIRASPAPAPNNFTWRGFSLIWELVI